MEVFMETAHYARPIPIENAFMIPIDSIGLSEQTAKRLICYGISTLGGVAHERIEHLLSLGLDGIEIQTIIDAIRARI
jgi:hypothetical protein